MNSLDDDNEVCLRTNFSEQTPDEKNRPELLCAYYLFAAILKKNGKRKANI